MNIPAQIKKIISGEISFIDVDELDKTVSETTLREILLEDFEILGIDIAFSGKGKNEKGVIIDLDDSYQDKLNSEGHPLKLGRTVVCVNKNND